MYFLLEIKIYKMPPPWELILMSGNGTLYCNFLVTAGAHEVLICGMVA